MWLMQVEGDNHPMLATPLHNVAYVLQTQGHLGEARKAYEEALRVRNSFGQASGARTRHIYTIACGLPG
jgi:hypothetical protein